MKGKSKLGEEMQALLAIAAVAVAGEFRLSDLQPSRSKVDRIYAVTGIDRDTVRSELEEIYQRAKERLVEAER